MNKMEFVSIGPCCFVSQIIKDANLRKNVYPFDITLCTFDIVIDCLKTNFSNFLDLNKCEESFHNEHNPYKTLYHSLYTDIVNKDICIKRHFEYMNIKNNSFFIHHTLEDIDIKLRKRSERFMNLYNNNPDSMCMVYISCYNKINEKEDIEKYIKFSEIVNCKVLIIRAFDNYSITYPYEFKNLKNLHIWDFTVPYKTTVPSHEKFTEFCTFIIKKINK